MKVLPAQQRQDLLQRPAKRLDMPARADGARQAGLALPVLGADGVPLGVVAPYTNLAATLHEVPTSQHLPGYSDALPWCAARGERAFLDTTDQGMVNKPRAFREHPNLLAVRAGAGRTRHHPGRADFRGLPVLGCGRGGRHAVDFAQQGRFGRCSSRANACGPGGWAWALLVLVLALFYGTGFGLWFGVSSAGAVTTRLCGR